LPIPRRHSTCAVRRRSIRVAADRNELQRRGFEHSDRVEHEVDTLVVLEIADVQREHCAARQVAAQVFDLALRTVIVEQRYVLDHVDRCPRRVTAGTAIGT